MAQQPASLSPNEQGSDSAMLIETSKLGGQNEALWDTSPSCNNQALFNSDIDHSTALAVVPDLLYQNTAFDWEPNTEYVEEFEGFDVGANTYSNSNEFSLQRFSSIPVMISTIESTFSQPADCMFHTPYLVLRPMDFDYLSHSSSLLSPRSPFVHSYLSTSSQIGRTFLMQSIQSYTTLLTTSILPLFIHSVSLPTQGPSLPSFAPLEICKSIISLYASKTAATSPFIWRSITMEKDRFMKELKDADECTTISMLQAITLYILLRIFDQDSFSVDFDRELVHAMMVRYSNLENG